MCLNNYHCIQSNCTQALQCKWFASSIKTSLIAILNIDNGAQILNATCVSFSAFTVMSHVAEINASE